MMKTTLFALIVALLMVGCGEPDLSDPDVVEDATADAVDWSHLQDRDGVTYLPNTQEPFSGYAKQAYENEQVEVLAQLKDGYVVRLKQWQQNGTPRWDVGFMEGRVGIEGIPLKREGNIKKVGHGPATLWHENGQKKAEANLKDGKPDGPATLWYENGQKRQQINYKDGKRDGLDSWWYENGNKRSETNYKRGKKEGLSQGWNREGGRLSKENYHDGLQNGEATYYYSGNRIMNQMTFEGGKLMTARVWQVDGTECPFTNIEKGSGILVYYQFDGKMDKVFYSDGIEVEAEEYKGETGLIPTKVKHSFKDSILGERDSLPSANAFFKESRNAAFKGNSAAQFRIANLHLQGIGTPKNTTEAYAWLSVAHASGYEDALEVRGMLALSKDEIAKADQIKITIQKQIEKSQPTYSRPHLTPPISPP